MTKRKTEAEKLLTKLNRSEWRLGLPQCQKRSDSEIGIWRDRRALGISCAISNDDLALVRSKWSYDPIAGTLTALSGKNKGRVVGNRNTIGYLTLSVYNTQQLAHRIAWLIHLGELPPSRMVIDHINGDHADNRLLNLRVCRHAQNIQNHKLSIRNTSGVSGVSKNNRRGGWDAAIKANGQSISLGTHVRFEDAVAARRAAEVEYFGEYARKTA